MNATYELQSKAIMVPCLCVRALKGF